MSKTDAIKRFKIAIYSGTVPSTTFIEILIKGLANKNVKVYLFGKKTGPINYNKLKNIKVYAIPSNRIFRFIITFIRSILLLLIYPIRFYIVLKEFSKFTGMYSKWNWWSRYVPVALHLPDVFHVQWAKDLQYWFFLKDKFNCKIVLSLLGSHINYSPIADQNLAKRYNDLFPKVDAFHAVSNAIALEAQKYQALPEKIKVIHSPIQPATFDNFKEYKKKTKGPLKILSIGRHHWIKGYGYAISAIQVLKEKGMDFEYSIIAQGIVPENISFQVNQMGLQNEVLFLEGMPQKKLFNAMQHYDVLFLPSLNEGIANVVLEAMAIGLPVISTNCGGMEEVVKPKETGWLVPVRDPEALAEAIIDVSQTSESDLQYITQQAHLLVKAEFNAENSIKEYEALYQSLIN